MIIKNIEIKIISSLSDNYVYLINNKKENLTAVIDPSEGDIVDKILSSLNWSLDQIINTHHHNDHTAGNNFLKKKWNAKIVGPKYENHKIENLDLQVQDKDKIHIAGLETFVLHTPGHTKGHIIYYIPNIPLVFSGDTLFAFGCGRIFEGTSKQMWNSLKKFFLFDPKTLVFCGHNYTEQNLKFALSVEENNDFLTKKYAAIKNNNFKNIPTVPSKLSDEFLGNPFLRCNNKDFIEKFGNNNISPEEIFAKLRKMKDEY